jgi:maltose O-acetyltransferase
VQAIWVMEQLQSDEDRRLVYEALCERVVVGLDDRGREMRDAMRACALANGVDTPSAEQFERWLKSSSARAGPPTLAQIRPKHGGSWTRAKATLLGLPESDPTAVRLSRRKRPADRRECLLALEAFLETLGPGDRPSASRYREWNGRTLTAKLYVRPRPFHDGRKRYVVLAGDPCVPCGCRGVASDEGARGPCQRRARRAAGSVRCAPTGTLDACGVTFRSVARLMSKLRSFIMNTLLASVLVPDKVRAPLLRVCGIRIGDAASILPLCVMTDTNITIGPGALVNFKCFFENSAAITIGARAYLAMEVTLCTSSHRIGTADQRAGDLYVAPIAIGDGCWLGARVMVLPGVTIGDGCLIAAGAVVTVDCEPNGLYAGVPARRVRDLA